MSTRKKISLEESFEKFQKKVNNNLFLIKELLCFLAYDKLAEFYNEMSKSNDDEKLASLKRRIDDLEMLIERVEKTKKRGGGILS